MTAVHVAVVGTAGRGDAGLHLTREVYMAAVEAARGRIGSFARGRLVLLRSGGAAWMDHIVVSLGWPLVRLYLPCAWDTQRCRYVDSGVRDWRSNPGGTANYYHDQFERKTGVPSLQEIGALVARGCTEAISGGFFARNQMVAQVDYLLAFTWGRGDVPADGGTKHTWDVCQGVKEHVPLRSATHRTFY